MLPRTIHSIFQTVPDHFKDNISWALPRKMSTERYFYLCGSGYNFILKICMNTYNIAIYIFLTFWITSLIRQNSAFVCLDILITREIYCHLRCAALHATTVYCCNMNAAESQHTTSFGQVGRTYTYNSTDHDTYSFRKSWYLSYFVLSILIHNCELDSNPWYQLV